MGLIAELCSACGRADSFSEDCTACPVPVMVKVTGPAEVLTVMLPLATPSAVGAKYTGNVHEASAAKLSPQVAPAVEANSANPIELR